MRISTQYSKQRGASALEASFAVIPVLLVCFLGIEFVHLHQTQQLVSLALHEAGRTASVTEADHNKVNQTFAHALAPLFAPSGQAASASARRDATLERYRRLYALPLWQLELTDLEESSAKPHEDRAAQLELIYLHEPLQSWLRRALRQSARWFSTRPNGLPTKAQQQGLVALRLSRRVVLHAGEVRPDLQRLSEEAKQEQTQYPHRRQSLTQGLQPKHPPIGYGRQTTSPVSQLSSSGVNRRQQQTLEQTIPESKPKDQPDSTADRTGSTKALLLAPFKRESEQQELCGVLLCCSQ